MGEKHLLGGIPLKAWLDFPDGIQRLGASGGSAGNQR